MPVQVVESGNIDATQPSMRRLPMKDSWSVLVIILHHEAYRQEHTASVHLLRQARSNSSIQTTQQLVSQINQRVRDSAGPCQCESDT
jgi:hypothetical protein